MSPANRVRLIVSLLAVLAAGIVVGVVYATRQSPPQPKAQCKERPKPFIVPGTPTTNVAAVRAALALEPVAAARALEQLAFEAPDDPVVQFNYGTRCSARASSPTPMQAFRAAKQAGRDTFYEIQADVLLHPQYFPRAIRPSSPTSHDPLLVRGAIAAARRVTSTRPSGVWAKAARLHPKTTRRRSPPPSGASTWTTSRPRSRGSGRCRARSRGASRCGTTWACSSPGRVSATRRSPSSGSHARWARKPAREGSNTFLGGLVTGGTNGTPK